VSHWSTAEWDRARTVIRLGTLCDAHNNGPFVALVLLVLLEFAGRDRTFWIERRSNRLARIHNARIELRVSPPGTHVSHEPIADVYRAERRIKFSKLTVVSPHGAVNRTTSCGYAPSNHDDPHPHPNLAQPSPTPSILCIAKDEKRREWPCIPSPNTAWKWGVW